MKKTFSFVILLLSFAFAWTGFSIVSAGDGASSDEHLVTIYDRGEARNVISRAGTVGDVLREAGVSVDAADRVEPSLESKLNNQRYHVNIYRARPVLIIDGAKRLRVMTSQQSPQTILAEHKEALYDEDIVEVRKVDDILDDGGAGERLIIDRATLVRVDLYGKPVEMRTQATTFGEFLKEKKIVLGAQDGASLKADESLPSEFRIWRDGTQTVTMEQEIPFGVDQVQDRNRTIGQREVKTPGVKGRRTVTYEIDVRNGQEVARREIQSVVLQEPSKQVEIVGAKPSGGGLSKSKGVVYSTDSRGVVHRETYYDLPMNRVMGNCRGTYSVRAEDGVKVDQDGYVIIAANLARYPRCSVVETSLGLGKVYDTGGFASVHPDGFDLATDWSNNDGI